MKKEDNKYIKTIKEHNYRLTKNRLEVLECLNDDHHGHSIQDIVNHIKSRNKKINTASVYNAINLLIKEGLIDINSNYYSKYQKYEIVDRNNLHLHIHLLEENKEIKTHIPDTIKNEIVDILDKYNLDYHNIRVEVLAKKK